MIHPNLTLTQMVQQFGATTSMWWGLRVHGDNMYSSVIPLTVCGFTSEGPKVLDTTTVIGRNYQQFSDDQISKHHFKIKPSIESDLKLKYLKFDLVLSSETNGVTINSAANKLNQTGEKFSGIKSQTQIYVGDISLTLEEFVFKPDSYHDGWDKGAQQRIKFDPSQSTKNGSKTVLPISKQDGHYIETSAFGTYVGLPKNIHQTSKSFQKIIYQEVGGDLGLVYVVSKDPIYGVELKGFDASYGLTRKNSLFSTLYVPRHIYQRIEHRVNSAWWFQMKEEKAAFSNTT